MASNDSFACYGIVTPQDGIDLEITRIDRPKGLSFFVPLLVLHSANTA